MRKKIFDKAEIVENPTCGMTTGAMRMEPTFHEQARINAEIKAKKKRKRMQKLSDYDYVNSSIGDYLRLVKLVVGGADV